MCFIDLIYFLSQGHFFTTLHVARLLWCLLCLTLFLWPLIPYLGDCTFYLVSLLQSLHPTVHTVKSNLTSPIISWPCSESHNESPSLSDRGKLIGLLGLALTLPGCNVPFQSCLLLFSVLCPVFQTFSLLSLNIVWTFMSLWPAPYSLPIHVSCTYHSTVN